MASIRKKYAFKHVAIVHYIVFFGKSNKVTYSGSVLGYVYTVHSAIGWNLILIFVIVGLDPAIQK